ncbi:unnamed protein product [Closterium sp. NIES-65]|nr:unnamed protein product [Closterium sp. NIES-65]
MAVHVHFILHRPFLPHLPNAHLSHFRTRIPSLSHRQDVHWGEISMDVHWGEISMVDAERRLLANAVGVHSSHPPSPPHSPSSPSLHLPHPPFLSPQDVHWGEISMVDAERLLLANALLDPGNAHIILDVHWEISMVDAERRLLANALLDPGNARFILVSESCAPLFNFTFVYEYLMASPEAYLTRSMAPNPASLVQAVPSPTPLFSLPPLSSPPPPHPALSPTHPPSPFPPPPPLSPSALL